jgi:hypothetical protein
LPALAWQLSWCAGARRRIELFLKALKANTALRQVRDHLDEMAQ